MSSFLRRTSDFFKHHTGNQRHRQQTITKRSNDAGASVAERMRKHERRESKQLEKDRAEFAATRR
ncbi:hypothetical protein N7493_003788 [Penicillium malachiteum]|uniref:Uncharacterized protein n=1 Tax=Penicillium malachiteum TaxID=1324776 RepID=A0AAD6MXT8_9EURO|nr:hypothetical protein N7493_003788 [Penicillium malachiteum]